MYKITEETVAPKSAASSANATDIVPLSYKVTLDDGEYMVKLPKGMTKLLIKKL